MKDMSTSRSIRALFLDIDGTIADRREVISSEGSCRFQVMHLLEGIGSGYPVILH